MLYAVRKAGTSATTLACFLRQTVNPEKKPIKSIDTGRPIDVVHRFWNLRTTQHIHEIPTSKSWAEPKIADINRSKMVFQSI